MTSPPTRTPRSDSRARRAGRGAVKPFDAATKFLLELDPAAWLAYLGLTPGASVAVVDSDVATIAAQADKVLRVDDPTPWLLHLEFQATRDPALGTRLHYYNALLDYRHGLPVRSVALLLRPEADAPSLTERLRRRLPGGEAYLQFRYRLVRVWQRPVEAALAGPVATLPLAPLAAGAAGQLPEIIRRIGERVEREVPAEQAAELWTATGLLMGLRYSATMIVELLRGVHAMRESSFYQAILAEGRAEGRAEGEARGRAEEARALLLRLGSRRFGPPDARIRAGLEQITELGRLERLTERVLDAPNWDDLLATP